MLVKDAKTKDYIVGFTDLGKEITSCISVVFYYLNPLVGNHDEFSTEMLEWRIATAGLIEYSGDLMCPPDSKDAKPKKPTIVTKGQKAKTIRQGGRGRDEDSSDEDDW